MHRKKFGGSVLWVSLVLLTGSLSPLPSVAQDLERHGEVTAIDGQELTVQLSEGLSVSPGTAGTIYTTTTVGGEERAVRVAQVKAMEVEGRAVTTQISERTQAPETGFAISFSQIQRFGTLVVTAEPRSAEVFVEGSPVGSGTVQTTVRSGTRDIRVSGEGCPSASRSVEVRQAQTRKVQLRLDCGTLRVTSEPQEAEVLVGDQRTGVSPVETMVRSGQQEIKARAENCLTASKTVAIRKAETREVQFQLDCTTLVVQPEPQSATVSIDGQSVGNGEIRQPVAAGQHRIKVEQEGYEEKVATVKVERGDTQRRSISLSAQPAQLSLKTMPSGASVYVRQKGAEEYRKLGKAPIDKQKIAAGTYDIWVRKGTRISRAEGVRFAPGMAVSESLSLEFSMEVVRTLQSPNPEKRGRFGFQESCDKDDWDNVTLEGVDAASITHIGDVNGDEVPDIAVGACGETVDGKDKAGRVYIFGGAEGEIIRTLQSPNPEEVGFFGASIAKVENMSRDDVTGVAVGAPHETVGAFAFNRDDGAGRVYAIEGSREKVRWKTKSPDSDLYDYFGSGITNIGNINGDKFSDIAVYAPQTSGEGKVFLFGGREGEEIVEVENPIQNDTVNSVLQLRGLEM